MKIKNSAGEKRSEISIQVKTIEDMPIFHIMPRDSNFELHHTEETEEYLMTLKDIRLFPGSYSINLVSANTTGHQVYDNIENAISFNILDGGKYTQRNLPRSAGLFFQNPDWIKLW